MRNLTIVQEGTMIVITDSNGTSEYFTKPIWIDNGKGSILIARADNVVRRFSYEDFPKYATASAFVSFVKPLLDAM